jgi:hypothetical protein
MHRQVLGADLNCSEWTRTLPAKAAAHLLLFALPNQNADHSTPERIRITDVASFYEPIVAVKAIVMHLIGARPSVLPNQIDLCGEVVPLNAIVTRIGNYRRGCIRAPRCAS